MCGIAGMVGFRTRIENAKDIYAMMKAQKHRGPDDEGAVAYRWNDEKSIELYPQKDAGRSFDGVLGFNRLSILDTSYAGHQPMVDDSGKVILIFNGEIYNAFQLKKELLNNYMFKSKTDTEVILALYLKYGFEHMIQLLNGMFAFCIVDMRIQSVFLARDRFGIKPLYYSIQNGVLYFASEYKSLIMNPVIDKNKRLDISALTEYFNFRSTLSRTMLENIQSVNPGEYFIVNNQNITTRKFYEIRNFERADKASDNIENAVWNKLVKSVGIQLVSDVRVGCQLSGGIDSSLISYIISDVYGKGLDSVSIVFEDERFTEEEWIDYVSNRLNLHQHKYVFNTSEFIDLLEKCVWYQESVITHPNTICLMWLTQKAKEKVTVLLSGEGADELFAGYPRFSQSVNGNLSLNEIVTATTTIPKQLRDWIFPENIDECIMEERMDLVSGFTGTLFDKQVKYEFITYLPELLLRQDKMSMANSIENRVPFLDNDLVSAVFAIPQEVLCKAREEKAVITKNLLKNISEKVYGKNFTHRKKMGFSVPIQNYIKNSHFEEYLYDLILPGVKTRGIFNAEAFINLYNNISVEKYSYNELEAFWRMLTAEIWCQLYLDKRSLQEK